MDATRIKTYTRKQALESRHQFVRAVRNESIQHTNCVKKAANPFSSASLLSRSQLTRWSSELSKRGRIAAGFHYVDTELGPIGYTQANQFLSLHTVKDVKAAVEQEIMWFNSPKLAPRSVSVHPSTIAINCFKSLIWNNPNLSTLPEYGVYLGILAQLCCNRFVHSDHVSLIKQMLNKEQSGVKCIYLNYHNRVNHRDHRKSNDPLPKSLCFVVNVGLGNNNTTYCGDDGRQGNHWTVAVYDHASKKVTYGDSLGWDIPEDLISRIKVHVDRIFGPDTSNIEVEMCHDPASHRNGRQNCGDRCSRMCPFQTCSNICGVVAIIVASIACHQMPFFRRICSKTCIAGTPNIYIREPTKYAKYLRSVLMTWIAEKK